MPDSALGDKGGISRRQLLARGTVAAGIVWAAPVIRTTSAYATTSDGTERPATRFFCVAIDASNHVWPVFPGGGADLPPGWRPESAGNGWPQPWDGNGEPPWAKTSTQAARGKVYTYRPDTVAAGPGRSVALALRPADTTTTTAGPGADPTVLDGSGLDDTGLGDPGLGDAAGTDAGSDDSGIDTGVDVDTGTDTGSGESIDGNPVDDATVAADNPEMPDADQFSRRIGADLPDPLPPPIVDWVFANPGVELEAPDRRPSLTQVGDSAWACVLPAPPALPDWWSRRYRLVLGCYKDGNYFGDDGYEDPDPPSSELGRRLLFPTRVERVGGYAGVAGRPGRAGPDLVASGDTKSTRVGGPGSSVRFDDEPATTSPAQPRQPDQPDLPDLPGSGSSTTTTSTTSTTLPGTKPVWDPAKCVPDPKAEFPWNLPYPTNFVVAWFGPRYGFKIPPPPASACLPPPPDPDPTSASTSTTTTTRPAKHHDDDKKQDAKDKDAKADDTDASSSTTTTTTTTTPPAAAAAPAAPQAPTDEISHQPKARTKRVKYSHVGHLGDHECIVLIYCRP